MSSRRDMICYCRYCISIWQVYNSTGYVSVKVMNTAGHKNSAPPTVLTHAF